MEQGTTMKWISVSDRLPTEKAICFAYLPALKPNKGVLIVHWSGESFGLGDYQDQITHWMPLVFPDPPKKD